MNVYQDVAACLLQNGFVDVPLSCFVSGSGRSIGSLPVGRSALMTQVASIISVRMAMFVGGTTARRVYFSLVVHT